MTPKLRSEQQVRQVLADQRAAIVSKIEDCALDVLSGSSDEGAALVAEAIRQAAEVARWTPFDLEADA